MSVVIGTNTAANIAANNLSYSSTQLKSSLAKLSSGSRLTTSSDDPGGLGVAMKLTATANRDSVLAGNLSDATSYAQTQDGALQVTGSILDRISQLEALYKDPTKNSSDLANYDSEFTQLKDELNSLESQTFNGINLFGTDSLSVDATDDLSTASAISVAEADVFGTGSTTLVSDDFSDSSDGNFTLNGFASISGGTLSLTTNGSATTTQTFGGAFQINFDISSSSASTTPWGMALTNTANGVVAFGGHLSDGATHSVQVNRDASGNISFTVDGSPTADTNNQPLTGNTGTTAFEFYIQGAASTPLTISNFVASVPGTSNLSNVTSAGSLGSLSLSTVTGAIQDVATARAKNGAEQSRLAFASTMLTANQTNLQSAVSNLSDVDVAQETTNLAKWNVLVQAGTSMLTQANQSAQEVLKLITAS